MYEHFIRFLGALAKFEVDYILIGGFAVYLHGMSRFTEDVDIFLKMTPENLEKFRKALASIYEDDSIEEFNLDELAAYPVIRYFTPDHFVVDVMSRLGEVAEYEDLNYEIVTYENTPVRLATAQTLFDLKKDTIRPQDKMDAFYLYDLIQKKQEDQ